MRNGLAAWFQGVLSGELRMARSIIALGCVCAVVGCSDAGAGSVYPVTIEAGEAHEFEVQQIHGGHARGWSAYRERGINAEDAAAIVGEHRQAAG